MNPSSTSNICRILSILRLDANVDIYVSVWDKKELELTSADV